MTVAITERDELGRPVRIRLIGGNMAAVTRCEICHALLAGATEGHAAHLKKYHNVTVTPETERPPMDPAEKRRIVQQGEERLGLRHFISPERTTKNLALERAEKMAEQTKALLDQAQDEPAKAELRLMLEQLNQTIKELS